MEIDTIDFGDRAIQRQVLWMAFSARRWHNLNPLKNDRGLYCQQLMFERLVWCFPRFAEKHQTKKSIS